MVIFNGKYRWDGTKKDGEEPVAWFPGAYNLLIVDYSGQGKRLQFMKPYICIFSKTGEGQSIDAGPDKFARRICSEFSLIMERVFWVEERGGEHGKYEVLAFSKSGRLGDTFFYRVERRKPLASELRVIQRAIAMADEGL